MVVLADARGGLPSPSPTEGLCPLLLTPNGEARSTRSALKLAYGSIRHSRAVTSKLTH
jgi:hypothetical protein